jgi:hypothetical protein
MPISRMAKAWPKMPIAPPIEVRSAPQFELGVNVVSTRFQLGILGKDTAFGLSGFFVLMEMKPVPFKSYITAAQHFKWYF